ncbi:alpha/beta hydrolase [Rhodanobacter sp. 7MK24]|uniref:alpha/beta fold hydrolase n=1 Tax=Rhodanobacter sp. 7MK24 TaxID=2775922 RepID=UPI00177BFBD0|nr:alpha/beta hydrolase [Rhodanobacter sp. 7MK24]MBD8878982.1 alpha/beta hydrolase [Rhodanobacter sp. 7MK24]
MYLRIAATAILSVGVVFAAQCLGQEAAKPLVTSPVYTKPQQLVDMDHGRRMNIYCLGSGSPTVILDAGMGDSTISWALVQPALAARTKVCSYDRAGLGFSDGSSRPSAAANIAEDLHALLKAAHVAPPYVLVGHSAAGMYIRVYADRYPDEVVGMVSVEGSHEDQWVRGWAIGAPGQQAKWDAFLKEYGSCVDEARRGLVPGTPAYKKCVGDPDPRFSPAINAAQARYAATVRWQSAAASERQSVAYASADQARATRRHYGDMPIIVLTHSPYPKAKDETQEERNQRTLLWESLHLDVAAMSTRGVNEIVPNSGHYIQYEHPQIVIDAIDQALSIAREDMRKTQ